MERCAYLHVGSVGASIASVPDLRSALNEARRAGNQSEVTEYTRRLGVHEANITRAGRAVPGGTSTEAGRRTARGSTARSRVTRGGVTRGRSRRVR